VGLAFLFMLDRHDARRLVAWMVGGALVGAATAGYFAHRGALAEALFWVSDSIDTT